MYYLAIDIGASSGRHILGWLENGKLVLEEIHRFQNGYRQKDGHDCWDMDALFAEIIKGMKNCAPAGKIPKTVGIDTWAVDFVLVDKNGCRLGDCVSYRDKRTDGIDKEAEKKVPFVELYGKTGIQKQPYNTVYQLLALKKEQPELFKKAERMLLVPDYFHYLLTGRFSNEYTNATSTALVNAEQGTWDTELLQKMELPEKLFLPLSMPGTKLGALRQDIAAQVGYQCDVVLPATHDTASAFLAVPARDKTAVYLSSGTWSLLGCESAKPVITKEGMQANFTNEGGYQHRYRVLKNSMGLWMIQSVCRELQGKYSYAELEKMARECAAFEGIVDVEDTRFLAPASMQLEIDKACAEAGYAIPETTGERLQCIYRSLAAGYQKSVRQLESLTGKQFTCMHIVGGGSRDNYLNRLTAQATGLPVYAGPTEGTAIGNLLVQMLAAGGFHSLQQARNVVRNSFQVREEKP